jgi:hypothetical protein
VKFEKKRIADSRPEIGYMPVWVALDVLDVRNQSVSAETKGILKIDSFSSEICVNEVEYLLANEQRRRMKKV